MAQNVLNRQFATPVPNRVWASDITTVRTWEGWLYLSVVLDLRSRRVVGWSMADYLRSDLVMDALRMAIGLRRPKPGHLLHHSDRGSQFAGQELQDVLEAHKIGRSMSRRGDCRDNAPVESFFRTLKRELIPRRRWSTRREVQSAIAEYIMVFYNR